MDNQHRLVAGFMFGIRVAEHVHGIKSRFEDDTADKILETVQLIAEGHLTLVDTPAEKTLELASLPESLKETLPRLLAEARKHELPVARELWNDLR